MAMAMKKYLIPLTAAIILLITATGIIRADANSPVQIKPDANKVAKTISAAAPVPQQNDQTAKMQQEFERLKTENSIAEKAVKSYEKSVSDLRWGIGIIAGLIGCILALTIVFAGYVVFKDRQDYERAVKQAEKAAEETEKCAQKAREAVSGIDKTVDDKLKEIGKKADDAIAKIGEKAESERKKSQKDAEKERGIFEPFAEGVRAIKEGRFEDSCKSWQVITTIKPDISEAWNNWGNALLEQAKKKEGAEADRLFEDSYAKYKKATDLKPNNHEAWNNWGSALLDQAEKKEGPEKKKLLQEAKEKCLKAEQIKKGEGSYNLACISAIDGNEDECKKWLKTGEDSGALDTRKHAMADEYLKTYREKDWFKAIKWKGEK
jgi:Flp pilus assembly protein TadD